MLETPQERVELLKAGISGKKIEELYISSNNFKIVHNPVLWEKVEINPQRIICNCTAINQEVDIELCLRIG
jgi:hypothetical protein